MKQVVQNFKTGVVSVEDVPSPQVKPGHVLVRNLHSLISVGTEGGTVKLGKMSMLSKARARPEQVKKVIKAIRSEGLLATVDAVNKTLDLPIPLGYSCAGVVAATGEGVTDLQPGDRVACGGGGMAYHAGVVLIPRNLCVAVPDAVTMANAAFTTVGSIAMQSVRIADVKVGENCVVIGLGLVGLLTVQILRAAGCRVVGIDIDRNRVQWVNDNNFCLAVERGADNLVEQVLEATRGIGADTIIVTAAVNNNDPVALAGELARHKGRVVVVGRTVMDAPRDTYLFKELELRTSLAYGPGTSDPTYEIEGYDYPVAYVRWTENRNMQCFLDLVADGKVDLDLMTTHQFPIAEAPVAFERVANPTEPIIGIVLDYGEADNQPVSVVTHVTAARPGSPGRVRVGLIGSGSFATNFMLPTLMQQDDVDVTGIVSATGIKATALAKKHGIPMVASDASALIESDDIDAILICTRHGTHASFATQALQLGKHVLVEKPAALNDAELDGVIAAQQESGSVLMVGFNRRYSPLALKVKAFFAGRCQPMILDFRGNVGHRPPEHWLHDPVDGGGVVLGEGCHYIDFCRWLVDSPIADVQAWCVGQSDSSIISEDNAGVTLRFEDGSVANVLYVSNGAIGLGREQCEAHAESKSALWQDFKYVKLVTGVSTTDVSRSRVKPDKGFGAELNAFFGEIREPTAGGPPWLAGQIDASRATIRAAGIIAGVLE